MRIVKVTLIIFIINSSTILSLQKSCETYCSQGIIDDIKRDLPWIFGDSILASSSYIECSNPQETHETRWMSDLLWLDDGSLGVRLAPDEAWRLSQVLPKFKLKVKKIHAPSQNKHEWLIYFDQELGYDSNLTDVLKFQLNKEKKPLIAFLDNAKSSLAFGGGLIHYGGQLGDTLIANGFMVREGLFNTRRVLTGRGLQLASLYYNSPKRVDCKALSADDMGSLQVRNRCFQDQKELIESLMSHVP